MITKQKHIRRCVACKSSPDPGKLRAERPGQIICSICGHKIADNDRGMSSEDLSAINRIRTDHTELTVRAKGIIDKLSIRDSTGRITETGHSVVNSIKNMVSKGKNIDESLDIIGKDKWLKLQEIWKILRKIESDEKKIIAKYI